MTVATDGHKKDGQPTVDTVVVTSEKKMILGVPCTVVRDIVTSKGKVVERTKDFFTQDVTGNVWYFGEATAELENGKVVSTEGSWQAGVKGAIPGTFMPADPKVGDSFRQEFFKGHAEDHFKILSLSASVKVPFGSFKNAMLTEEFTPLEPGVIDHKYYVRGIGLVSEATVKGPKETSFLVGFKKP